MSSDQGWGQGWTLISLALVMSHGGVLVEPVVVVSPPRPLPQDQPLPSPKIDLVYGPLLRVWGCPYGLASPAPESPGKRVLDPTTEFSTRKMTISGSKSAKNKLNQAILSKNSAIFTQIYRYITHNNHYQQRSDYVDQEGYHGYVPGDDF